MLPILQGVFRIRVRPVADAFSGIQVHIVHASIIGGQGRDHLVLFCPKSFLFQQLLLESQPLLQFFLLDPVFRFRRFPFQYHPGRPTGLPHHDPKESQQHQPGKNGLKQAPPGHSAGDRTDLIADDAFADQVRQHPVRALYRDVEHRLLDIVIGKGDTPLFTGLEVLYHLIDRVSPFRS